MLPDLITENTVLTEQGFLILIFSMLSIIFGISVYGIIHERRRKKKELGRG